MHLNSLYLFHILLYLIENLSISMSKYHEKETVSCFSIFSTLMVLRNLLMATLAYVNIQILALFNFVIRDFVIVQFFNLKTWIDTEDVSGATEDADYTTLVVGDGIISRDQILRI